MTVTENKYLLTDAGVSVDTWRRDRDNNNSVTILSVTDRFGAKNYAVTTHWTDNLGGRTGGGGGARYLTAWLASRDIYGKPRGRDGDEDGKRRENRYTGRGGKRRSRNRPRTRAMSLR